MISMTSPLPHEERGPATTPDHSSHSTNGQSAPSSSPCTTAPLPLSSAIDLLILDLTTEFHDDGHVMSNRTQAARLWHASLLDEGDFIEVLYSARALVRSRGNIEKRATSGPPHLRNRMPYFFATLRNELRRIGRLATTPETRGPDRTSVPSGGWGTR